MTTEEKKKGEKPTCYDCHQEIIFDKKIVGKSSGRMIPLDPKTREPHRCPEEIKTSEDSQTELSKQNEERLRKNGTAAGDPRKIDLKSGVKELERQEPVKAEYLDHTLARPSEVKIFFSTKRYELEQEYKQFQIGKKFAWTRAQYQGVYSPTAIEGIIHSIAFYYELAK